MSNVCSIPLIVFVVTCLTGVSKSEYMPPDIDIATYSAVNSATGSKIQLSCTSSSVGDVLWAYSNTLDGQTHDVYSHGAIVNGYRGRFFFKNTSANGKTHYLIISRAECRDAGLYWCIERNGIGSHHQFLVSVIDTRQPMTPTDSGAAGGTAYPHSLLDNATTDSVIDSAQLLDHKETSMKINSCTTSIVIAVFVTCIVCAVMMGTPAAVCWWLNRKTLGIKLRTGTAKEQRGLISPGETPHAGSFLSPSPTRRVIRRTRFFSEPPGLGCVDYILDKGITKIAEANEKLKGMGTRHSLINDLKTAGDDDNVFKIFNRYSPNAVNTSLSEVEIIPPDMDHSNHA